MKRGAGRLARRVIALPGTLLDRRSLEPALRAAGLAAAAQVEGLGVEPSFDDELRRLATLTQAPALWIGHSLGGIAALHLAAAHPQKVAALVVLAATARAASAGGAAAAARRAAQWSQARSQGLAALVHGSLAPAYALGDGDAALAAELADQAEAVGLARFAHQLAYAGTRPGLLAPRRALRVPVLALSGALDGLCPPEHGDEIAALASCGTHVSRPGGTHVSRPGGTRVSLPGGTHETLPGGGHLFPMQQAGWAGARIAAFLQTLDPDR